MFYAIVTSGPMAEHNNGRLNTIGLYPIGPTPTATHDDVTFSASVLELYGTS